MFSLCRLLCMAVFETAPEHLVLFCDGFEYVLSGARWCAFMFFKTIKIKYSSFINTVASTTFGILLIHANCDAMRRFLWQDVCQNVKVYDSQLMPLISIGCVCAVFCGCSLIDWLRIRFIEKPFMKKFSVWEPKIIAWWHRKEEKYAKF